MTEPDDARLIADSVREPELFGTIFDRHASTIHRYLARRLGSGAADDLVAETFLAAFRRRERYDPQRPNARPWLYGIATHVIAAHRREEARQVRLLGALAPERNDDGHDDRVAADVTARSARTELVEALTALTADERDVLLLVAWEDLSYDEVAFALGIPIGTVRSRLSRARQRTRDPLMSTKERLTHG